MSLNSYNKSSNAAMYCKSKTFWLGAPGGRGLTYSTVGVEPRLPPGIAVHSLPTRHRKHKVNTVPCIRENNTFLYYILLYVR